MNLRYTSTLSPAARLSLLAAGLVPLLAPYELLLRPAWVTHASAAFVLALIISAGAVAVSVLLLAAAVAGVDEEVWFDPAGRQVVHRGRSPVARLRVRRHSFDGIQSVATDAVQWDSRADTYRLRLVTRDGHFVHFGAFDSREAAERARAEVLTVVQGDAMTLPAPDWDPGTESTARE